MNCAYYSALGNEDEPYLLARAIQFFTPGIPLVYYVGLLAGANDIEGVEATKVGRDINRHMYGTEEAEQQLQRPVVKACMRQIIVSISWFLGVYAQLASRVCYMDRSCWSK